MAKTKDAPGRAESTRSAVCLHRLADIDAPNTTAVRRQFLARHGLPTARAAIVAPLLFGEAL
jgi:hypothetical protein